MSRTSELLKQPYAMGRDSFVPATPYAAGLQTRQITGQTTGRTPSVATVPAAPVPTKHRTPAEINFDIDQLQKKRKAIMSEAQKLLQQLGPGTEVSDVSIRGEIGKRAKEQYGKAGEFTPQIKALEKELEQSKAAERKRFMEEEGYRDASPLDLTLRSGKQGYFNSIYGQESYKDMMGLESDKQKYEDLLAGEEYKFLPNGAFQEAVSGGAAQVGQWIRQWSDPRSLAYASSAAGMTALAGQAGPQALAPEEVLTVPGAFFTGLSVGSAQTNLEIEAGFAYNEMIGNGISPETARTIAAVVGVGNAALEFVQADELLKSFKVLKKFDATKGLAGQLFNELLDRGLDVGGEAFQELGQEGVTIAGVQIANLLEKGEWAYDAPTVAGRLGDTVRDSTLSFGASNVPSAMLHTSQIIGGDKAYQKQLWGPLAIPDGLDEATYSRLNQAAGEMYAADQAQKTAPTEGTEIKVGQATILKSPYSGEIPVQGAKRERSIPCVSDELVNRAQTMIKSAEDKAKLGYGAFKNLLTRGYEAIFKSSKHIEVDGLTFQGAPYYVDINNGVPAKVISDVNHSPEKLALLEILADVVKNGEFVGSTNGKKKVVRYDHFETAVTIHGKPYLVLFETEVYPGANNYKTHRLISMELAPQTDGVTGTPPAPSVEAPTPYAKRIPQVSDGVKYPSGYVSSVSAEALTADRIEYAPRGGTDIPLDEATYSRLNQAAEEMYAADQAQKTASIEGTGKIDPGARKTIREQVTEMPSADYQIPYISMPEEIMVGIDGQQVPESKMPSAIRKYMAKLFRGKVLSIGKNHKVYIGKDGVEEYAFPARRISGEIKTAKMTAGANLDVTLEPAQFLKSGVDDGHHPEATGGWEYFYVMFETDTGIYSGIVNTKVTDRGRVFHDITEIQKESGPPTRGVNKETLLPAKTDPLSSDPIIPTPGDGVNIEYAPRDGEDILTEAALDMGASGKQGQRKRDAETIRRASSTFGPVGAQMLQEFYRGSDQAPEKYFGGFAVYYHAGLTGQDIMTVQGEYADALNSAQAKAAYRAGQLDAANSGDVQTPPASR